MPAQVGPYVLNIMSISPVRYVFHTIETLETDMGEWGCTEDQRLVKFVHCMYEYHVLWIRRSSILSLSAVVVDTSSPAFFFFFLSVTKTHFIVF